MFIYASGGPQISTPGPLLFTLLSDHLHAQFWPAGCVALLQLKLPVYFWFVFPSICTLLTLSVLLVLTSVVIIHFYIFTFRPSSQNSKLTSIYSSGVPQVSTRGPLLFVFFVQSPPFSILTSVVCCSTPLELPCLLLVCFSIHLLPIYVICPFGVDPCGDYALLHFHILSIELELQNLHTHLFFWCSSSLHTGASSIYVFVQLPPRSILNSVVCCFTPVKVLCLFLISLSIHLFSPYIICPLGVDPRGDY
jgi:hypothetical protein